MSTRGVAVAVAVAVAAWLPGCLADWSLTRRHGFSTSINGHRLIVPLLNSHLDSLWRQAGLLLQPPAARSLPLSSIAVSTNHAEAMRGLLGARAAGGGAVVAVSERQAVSLLQHLDAFMAHVTNVARAARTMCVHVAWTSHPMHTRLIPAVYAGNVIGRFSSDFDEWLASAASCWRDNVQAHTQCLVASQNEAKAAPDKVRQAEEQVARTRILCEQMLAEVKAQCRTMVDEDMPAMRDSTQQRCDAWNRDFDALLATLSSVLDRATELLESSVAPPPDAAAALNKEMHGAMAALSTLQHPNTTLEEEAKLIQDLKACVMWTTPGDRAPPKTRKTRVAKRENIRPVAWRPPPNPQVEDVWPLRVRVVAAVRYVACPWPDAPHHCCWLWPSRTWRHT